MIKLVIAEEGTDLAEELWSRAGAVLSSHLVYPEARAAVAAAHRAGRIDATTSRRAVTVIDELCSELQLLGVDADLARAAGAVAAQHALRGYDAVHLTSALAVADPELVLATWDGDLAKAGKACELIVAPVT